MVDAPASPESLVLAACIVTHHSDLMQLQHTIASFDRVGLNKQLLIVDNNSSESYRAELRTIAAGRLLENAENRGFGAGHNFGLRAAPPSRYYLVLNPDVVIADGALESMVAYMDAHPDIGILSPKTLNPDGTLQYLNKRDPSVFDLFARRLLPPALQSLFRKKMDRYIMKDVGYDKPCELEFMSGCFMLFCRPLIDRLGGFDEQFFLYLEDADISRRARPLARVVYYPDAQIVHVWQRGSHKSRRLFVVMLRSMWYYFGKWGWRFW